MVYNFLYYLHVKQIWKKTHSVTQGFSNLTSFRGQSLEKSNSFASGTPASAATSTSKAANLLWKQSPMQGALFAEK